VNRGHTVEEFYAQRNENDKGNWGILSVKLIYAILRKPNVTETIKLHRFFWFGHEQRMEENRISKRVLYWNLESKRPTGRARNRWQDELREDGRIVDGEEWQGKSI
jgi:hypothetical protein